jgi:hypothetical protein
MKGISNRHQSILQFPTITEANSIKNALVRIVLRNNILAKTQDGVISRLLT